MKIIGVAGGSGSGKTTFAKKLTDKIGANRVLFIEQDNYYFDHSRDFDFDGGRVNFDHPNALDWDLLVSHLTTLRMGEAVHMPQYDFKTHSRKNERIILEPKEFVILDGILIFVPEKLRETFDYRVFIKTSDEVRFARRLTRDVLERGRTEDGVRAQYFSQVQPMYDQFVLPSSAFAHEIVSGEIDVSLGVEYCCKKLKI